MHIFSNGQLALTLQILNNPLDGNVKAIIQFVFDLQMRVLQKDLHIVHG